MTAASATGARAPRPRAAADSDSRTWGHVVGWDENPDHLGDLADLLDIPGEGDWQERALCAQTDPEAFFPEKGGSTRYAKRICLGCEVKDDCLEYALAHEERFGVWGGLSEQERRKLRTRRKHLTNAAGSERPAAKSDTPKGESRC